MHRIGSGWRLARLRLRRGRGTRDDSSGRVGDELGARDETGDESATSPAVELIRTYGAKAAPASADVGTGEPQQHEDEGGKGQATADGTDSGADEEAEPRLEQRPLVDSRPHPAGDEPHGLAEALGDQIVRARQARHALALVEARLAAEADDRESGRRELRQRLDVLLQTAVGPAAQGELLFEGKEGIVWLILPGVLPKRALEVARELSALMEQCGLPPSALAVAGYPRDGKTAEELADRCRAAIDTIAASTMGPAVEGSVPDS
jgi:hypothetical protein